MNQNNLVNLEFLSIAGDSEANCCGQWDSNNVKADVRTVNCFKAFSVFSCWFFLSHLGL